MERVERRLYRFQTPKGVCLIGARSPPRRCSGATRIPDAERRLPHWSRLNRNFMFPPFSHSRRRKASASLEPMMLSPITERKCGFQTPKGVCLIGAAPSAAATCRASASHSRRRKASASLEHLRSRRVRQRAQGIPDAERRLPHWSAITLSPLLSARFIPDAERRLPHWSPFGEREARRRRVGFQTPKGVCLIGARFWRPPLFAAPHSRRRKASASLEHDDLLKTRALLKDSRRRKASASLEIRHSDAPFASPLAFQTPKGVCLIGADPRLGASQPRVRIPDAERRLPHWSGGARGAPARRHAVFQTPKGVCLIGAPTPPEDGRANQGEFQTPKGVCLIGSVRFRGSAPAPDGFQTPKGVCLIGAIALRAAEIARRANSRRRKASASLEPRPASRRRRGARDSRRRKASASLELLHRRSRRRFHRHSRRRKASASLELLHQRVQARLLLQRSRFQTPKGVCLIGVTASAKSAAISSPFQTPKGVCLIGVALAAGVAWSSSTFQTPKGVCLIGV